MTGSQIKTQLSRIVDSLIIEFHPEALDDMHASLLSEGENRQEAINRLIVMIEFYREVL